MTGTFTPPVDGGPFTIGADQMTYTGTGDELELSVTITAGSPTVTITNAGRGYTASETVTIPGTLIGGTSPTNNLVVTLATVSASNKGIFSDYAAEFTLTQAVGTDPTMDSLEVLGITDGTNSVVSTTTDWVDENPPIQVKYDAVGQRLQFTVERNILGTGTNSNFNSFNVYGAESAEDTNNLGIRQEGIQTKF